MKREPSGSVTRRITAILAKHEKGATVTNVSLVMGHSHTSVKSTMRRLVANGTVAHAGFVRQGRCRVARYRMPRPDEAAALRARAEELAMKPLAKRDEAIAFRETDETAAKLAELMGPHRYEDAPHKPEGRLQVASPLGLQSYTGCAAQMCLS